MADIKDFEAVLLKRLGQGDIDKPFLKEVSGKIVTLKKNGLAIDRVLVKGKPRVDRVIINGTVDPNFWGKFREYGPTFEKLVVFPYGIINPEGFRFTGTLGV